MHNALTITRGNDEPDKEGLVDPQYCQERVGKGLKQNYGLSFAKARSPYPESDHSPDSGDGESPQPTDHSPYRDVPSPTRGVHDTATHATYSNHKATTPGFNPCHVIWDCASSSNICSNAEIATNVKPCRPAAMAGIAPGTKVVYTQDCNLIDPAFGRWALATGSTANILSQSVAIDAGFQVKYENDTFVVSHPTRVGIRYVFGRSTGTRGSTKHYLMDCRTMLPPVSARTNIHILMGCELGDHTTDRELESGPLRITSRPYVRTGIIHVSYPCTDTKSYPKFSWCLRDIRGAFLHAHMKTDVQEAPLTNEFDDISYLGSYPRTDTRNYPKFFKPKRSHKITITFAASDSMDEVRRAVFRL